MNSIILKNANAYINGSFTHTDISCTNGIISEISSNITSGDNSCVIDCKGRLVIPGFIDIHTHGAVGFDVNAADEQGYQRISDFFASQGTTSWVASILTDTKQQTEKCILSIKKASQSTTGAQIVGIHLEGPFLSAQYKGAMPEHLLMAGNTELVRQYQKLSGGLIKYITVSPEVVLVPQMIEELSQDISFAIGHSGADYSTSMKCIENGAVSVTHTFNAMKLLHQHEPSILGAALESDVFCEAICDGRHLHPGIVRLLLKIKSKDKIVAVTDSIMATGLSDGEYKLGVNDIVVVDGDAKLKSNGVRAGSTLTMIKAFKNLKDFTNLSLEQIIPLLTINPARVIKQDNLKGSIDINKSADFVILDDELSVVFTIVKGKVVYNNERV